MRSHGVRAGMRSRLRKATWSEMSFFIRSKHKAKPGVSAKTKAPSNKEDPPKKKKKFRSDDEISSDSELESDDPQDHEEHSSEEEETAQEKRLRLAKQYLAQLESEEAEQREDEDERKALLGHRLKEDVLEQAGKLQRKIADQYLPPDESNAFMLKGHQLPITCVVISSDNKFIFSASKDCSIIKWNLETRKKECVIPGGRKGTEKTHIGHTDHILAMAISTDGKYLATGDKIKLIHIWDCDTCERLHTFTGHRGPVTGLAFRKGTHQLFSASQDRTVKIWSVDEMAYVETLFGHQDAITGIDSLTRERVVTSGGRDNSVRIWKIVEESQLVFNGQGTSIDCIALINEEHFVSGSDDNSISLWGVMKKKALTTKSKAHPGSTESGRTEENWITSVAALQNTDLIASGSKDGHVHFWKCGPDFKSLEKLFSFKMTGFVNSMVFAANGEYLVAGVGQEHRLGRWWRIKEAKNAVYVVPLQRKTPS